MLLSEALLKISYALRGVDDVAPSASSDEGTYWVSVLNTKKSEMYQDVKQNWASAYSVENLGTISAGDDISFELPDNFLGLAGDDFDDLNGSDVYVIKLDGSRSNLPVKKPSQRNNSQALYISGNNPQELHFSQSITADDPLVGGTLYAPCYIEPDDISGASEVLPVPNPNWLVQATAAEIAFSDIIYEDKAEGINAKANNLYRLMVQNNRRQTSGAVRQNTYKIKRITGTR